MPTVASPRAKIATSRTTMTDPKKTPLHPVLAAIPLTTTRVERLKNRYMLNGFDATRPLTIHEGRYVTGRDEVAAAVAAGVDVEVEVYTGPAAGVIDLALGVLDQPNLTIGQKAVLSARLMSGRIEGAPRLTNKDCQVRFGIGETAITEAVRVIANGVPELIAAVESGAVKNVKAAAVVATDLPADEQRRAVAAGDEGVRRAAARTKTARRRAAGGGPPDRPAGVATATPDDGGLLAEVLADIRSLQGKIDELITSDEGRRFVGYIERLGLPWIDAVSDHFLGLADIAALLTVAADPSLRDTATDSYLSLIVPRPPLALPPVAGR